MSHHVIVALAVLAGAAVPAHAQFMTFCDQSEARLDVESALVIADVEEKAYAWADLDRDGDVDLVVARKQPVPCPE